MKTHAVRPAELVPERLAGWVLCHDVRDGAGKLALRKGQVLDAPVVARLAGIARGEVHLIEMGPDTPLKELLNALKGNTIAKGEMMATYVAPSRQ